MDLSNITHVGFLKEDGKGYNIWNKTTRIEMGNDDSYSDAEIINISLRISDLNFLLDNENKDFLFLYKYSGHVEYVPIIEYREKVIVNEGKREAISEIKLSLLISKYKEPNKDFIFLNKREYAFQNCFESIDLLGKTVVPKNVSQIKMYNKAALKGCGSTSEGNGKTLIVKNNYLRID